MGTFKRSSDSFLFGPKKQYLFFCCTAHSLRSKVPTVFLITPPLFLKTHCHDPPTSSAVKKYREVQKTKTIAYKALITKNSDSQTNEKKSINEVACL